MHRIYVWFWPTLEVSDAAEGLEKRPEVLKLFPSSERWVTKARLET